MGSEEKKGRIDKFEVEITECPHCKRPHKLRMRQDDGDNWQGTCPKTGKTLKLF